MRRPSLQVVVFLVLALSGADARAQTTVFNPQTPTLLVGPVAAVGTTSFYGDGVVSAALTRVALGGAVTVPWCHSDCFVQAQVLYAAKGSQSAASGLTARVSSSYVEVPLLFGLYLQPEGNGPRLYAFAGPYLGLLTSCRTRLSGGLSGDGDCEELGLITRSTDVGGVFGAGLDLRVGGDLLTAMAKFEMGLSRVVAGYSAKNRGVNLALGYFIGVGR